MPAQKVENTSVSGDESRPRITLWHASLILVVIGLLISGYLSYVKLADIEVLCTEDGSFRCDVVQNSTYAEMFGIPVAYLGFLSYVVIGLLLVLQERIAFLQENGIILTFGVVFVAFLFSMYLVYIQGVVLDAWCPWCLTHEVNITVLFAVTGWRLRQFLATNW